MPSPDATPTTLASDLRRLNLPRTADDLNDVIARATRQRWSPTVLLEHFVTAELEDRSRRSVERRLKCARLGRVKPLADWAWNWPTALDRILALDFLEHHDNVPLVGAQGSARPCSPRTSCTKPSWPDTRDSSPRPPTSYSISTGSPGSGKP